MLRATLDPLTPRLEEGAGAEAGVRELLGRLWGFGVVDDLVRIVLSSFVWVSLFLE